MEKFGLGFCFDLESFFPFRFMFALVAVFFFYTQALYRHIHIPYIYIYPFLKPNIHTIDICYLYKNYKNTFVCM